jgi:Putative Actinobacterial Holin-X, holin superfamily III
VVGAAAAPAGEARVARNRFDGVSPQRNGSLRSRHVGELVKDLSHDFSRLINLEVELAKAEAHDLALDLAARVQQTVSDAESELSAGGHRAATELSEKGKQAGVAGGLFAGAATLALGAFGVLTAFLILVLAEAMPAWAAALIVLALYGAVAALLAFLGRNRWRRAIPLVPTTEIRQTVENVLQTISEGRERLAEAMPPVPEQTIETVKEDIEWVKHPTRSGAR